MPEENSWRKARDVLKESAGSFRLRKSRLHLNLLTILNEYDKAVKPVNPDNIKSSRPVYTVEGKGAISSAGDDGKAESRIKKGSRKADAEKGELEPTYSDETGNRLIGISADCSCYYSYKVKQMPIKEIQEISGLSEVEITLAVEKTENILTGLTNIPFEDDPSTD